MNTNIFNKTCDWLKDGNAILINCDTVYGLVSLNPTTIYDIKQRSIKKN